MTLLLTLLVLSACTFGFDPNAPGGVPTATTGGNGPTGDVPLINLSVYGTLGQNGWYVSNVTLNWSFSGPLYSSTGCSNTTLTADTPGTTLTCTATSLDRSTTMSLSRSYSSAAITFP